MKISKKYVLSIFIVVVSSVCIQSTFSQSQFSLSGHAGLNVIDGNYGSSISGKLGIAIHKSTGLELGYSYMEIEVNDQNSFEANRFSILAEQFIYSNDNKFRISGKIGPSLMTYNGFENENSMIGFDFGLESSYKIFNFLLIDFGLMNTLNKDGLMAQPYIGFSYDFNLKKKEVFD